MSPIQIEEASRSRLEMERVNQLPAEAKVQLDVDLPAAAAAELDGGALSGMWMMRVPREVWHPLLWLGGEAWVFTESRCPCLLGRMRALAMVSYELGQCRFTMAM